MLKRGDKIGITACSNGLELNRRSTVERLSAVLKTMGLLPVFSKYIYAKQLVFSGTAKERANALMNFYKDSTIKAIFDISGGDIANEILPFLDFKIIVENSKPFWGYSDLTTVINAIYSQTEQPSYLYQINNLVWDTTDTQKNNFQRMISQEDNSLFDIQWNFFKGSLIQGTVLGGNIRCLLKLAGTPYFPDVAGKILFVESLGGGIAQITTYFNQLDQMGVLKKICGLLLGTFTQMESENKKSEIKKLILHLCTPYTFPIAKTENVGHANTSKCLIIGRDYIIK